MKTFKVPETEIKQRQRHIQRRLQANGIDGLLIVDLHKTDPKILNRFVGRRYLAKAREEKKSGERRAGAIPKQVEPGV